MRWLKQMLGLVPTKGSARLPRLAVGLGLESLDGRVLPSSVPVLGPAPVPVVMYQDLDGDTLSGEDYLKWMSREHDVGNGPNEPGPFVYPTGRR